MKFEPALESVFLTVSGFLVGISPELPAIEFFSSGLVVAWLLSYFPVLLGCYDPAHPPILMWARLINY